MESYLYTLNKEILRKITVSKISSWFGDDDCEQLADICFENLYDSYLEHNGYTTDFKFILCDALSNKFPGWSDFALPSGEIVMLNIRLNKGHRLYCVSVTDDEFEEFIEEWTLAVYKMRNIEIDSREQIGAWILKHLTDINWSDRNKNFWMSIFKDVNENTVLPTYPPIFNTSKNNRLLWKNFRHLILEEVNASARHVPRGWFGCKPPKYPLEWIKRVRYIVRAVNECPNAARGQDPIADYGQIVGTEILKAFKKLEKDVDDPCIDNFRFAKLSKSGDVRRYGAIKKRGCCGFADKKIKINEEYYIIGCNYGH